MSIGQNSTAWANGTPAAPAWFQNTQDTLNVAYGARGGFTHYLLSEDFDAIPASVTASNTAIGKFVTTTNVLGTAFGGSTLQPLAVADGLFGCVQVQCTTSGTAGIGSLQLGQSTSSLTSLGVGSRDFKISFVIRAGAPTTLDPTEGISVGSKDSTAAQQLRIIGKGGGSWFVQYGATQTSLGISVPTNTWQLFEVERVSGVLNVKINGTPCLINQAFSTALTAFRPCIAWTTTTSAGTASEILAVDHFQFSVGGLGASAGRTGAY